MADEAEMKIAPVRSICLVCENAQMLELLIPVRKMSGPSLAGGQPHIEELEETTVQFVCHARGGASPLGTKITVQRCSDYVPGEDRKLEAPDDLALAPHETKRIN